MMVQNKPNFAICTYVFIIQYNRNLFFLNANLEKNCALEDNFGLQECKFCGCIIASLPPAQLLCVHLLACIQTEA